MGQTPSKEKQFADLYSSYIQQQQNMIYQQQQQINGLYQMNYDSQYQQQNQQQQYQQQNQQQQYQQQQNQQQQYQQQQNQQQQYQHVQFQNQPLQQPLLPSAKIKLDPYKILNISKNYDEKVLKRAYLKAAMKTHPDRGGTPASFQQVSIAYTLLMNKLKENDSNHSHEELRQMSKDYHSQQDNQPQKNVKMTSDFDVDVFNQIYNENKLPGVYDDGYGEWMENDNSSNNPNKDKLFQNGFNKDMFNSTFEKYKKEQVSKKDQLVKYTEPVAQISMSNKDSLVTLGQDKITDFGGEAGNLYYTDYKQAFTDGSMLIDTSSVNIDERMQSIGTLKSDRKNISYTMNSGERLQLQNQENAARLSEEKRLQRLAVYDKNHGEAYEKIHSMLLR